MNNIEQLKLDMKSWLCLTPKHPVTIQQCFDIANDQDEWRVKMFYVRFAPYMAKILDVINKGANNES